LGIPAAEPYYVLRLEPDHNRLVVGGRKDLESAGCFLSDFHFFGPWGEIAGPTLSAQIRYRHKPVPAAIRINDARRPALYFEKPQKAVTPGQAAVLYADDLLVGGGWIEEPW
jgi:tRNA-specific 2-thiouridylase